MRLSAVKLAGFKSFVDRTELRLPANLAGVVGPNGCGKSNVIDAVRWVLGESSARQLRGESMEDVIFNGSKGRKRVGKASVELLFDNSDHSLQGQFADYAEVSVRREVTREGSSQYFLNGSKCRRRDVVDLFLGTGLGARNSYAIIEQGTVGRLIEARPEEMRQVLEEAAGISRYKERRRETENRMRHTQENLERLEDIRGELHARLRKLERQAKNAEKYKEFKQQERRSKAELLVLKIADLIASVKELDESIAKQRDEVVDRERRHRERVELDASLRVQRREHGQVLQETQDRFYAAEAAISQAEQAFRTARDNRDRLLNQRRQLETEVTSLKGRKDVEEAKSQQEEQAITQNNQQLEVARSEETKHQQTLQTLQEKLSQAEDAWSAAREQAAAPVASLARDRAQLDALEKNRRRAEERQQRLANELAQLSDQPIQQALSEASRMLDQLNLDLEDQHRETSSIGERLQQARDARSEIEKQLNEAQQELAVERGRMRSLETLQQAALHENAPKIEQWLRQAGVNEGVRLAEQIQVEPGWEAAAEAALGPLLMATSVEDWAAVVRSAGHPSVGLSLVQGGRDSNTSTGEDRLSSKIQVAGAFSALANKIRVAESLPEALTLLNELQDGESIVTRDAVLLGAGWIQYPEKEQSGNGVIERERELKSLRKRCDALAATVESNEKNLQEARTSVRTLEAEREHRNQALDQLRKAQGEQIAIRQSQTVKLEQVQQRQQGLKAELAELAERETEASREKEKLTTAVDAAQKLADDSKRIAQQQESGVRELRTQRETSRQQLDQRSRERQSLELESSRQSAALASSKRRIADFNERLEALNLRLAEFSEEKLDEAPVQKAVSDQREAANQRELANKALQQARAEAQRIEQRADDNLATTQQAEKALADAREKLQALQLDRQSSSAREQSFDEQLAETGFARKQLSEEMPEGASSKAWEDNLAQLARRIERLGAINLAAISEYDECKERSEFLDKQHDDLTASLETLLEAIRKIDRETRTRFKDTFEAVNERFKGRFPILFGGGEGQLELTGDDLLDAGVRVMARPPGKRNSSIQMLSGGEKTMTALALLFALFELNPAPFCMLDEIDAPLDDANVMRFCDLVKEMAERGGSQNPEAGEGVQFVVITHNKVTMEMLSQLHGVTMEEPGVSRLVSVDIDQAVEIVGA